MEEMVSPDAIYKKYGLQSALLLPFLNAQEVEETFRE